MKKLVVLVLALAMVMTFFTACGNSGGGGTSASTVSTPSNTTSDSNSTSTSANNAPAVKLRLLTWVSEVNRPELINTINKALAQDNATISYDFIDNNQYDNIVNTQMAAGQGPDILECGGQFRGQQKAGYCSDFTNEPWVSDYQASYLDYFTIGGKLWGVPEPAMFAGIAYNKDIFKKYNIDTPKTWDELLAIGDKLKAAGFKGRPFVTGGADLGTPMWTMFGALNISFYKDPENRKFDQQFADLQGSAATTWKAPLEKYWAPFVKKYYTTDMVGLTTDQAQNEFALGNVAMCAGGGMGMGGQTDTLRKVNPDLTYGIFAYPSIDGSTGWAIGSPGSCFTANPNGKNLDIAKKAIAAIASKDGQVALSLGHGPIGLKGVELPVAPEADQSLLDALNAGNLYATWCNWPNAGQLLDTTTKELQLYIQGKATLDEYLKSFDDTNKSTHID